MRGILARVEGVPSNLQLGVRERVLEFLAKYGERGYAVLRAAVEAATSSGSRGVRLGDFSYKEVVAKLKAMGFEYNPSMLLSKLEKEYAVIETTYHSSNQHWWRFIDVNAVIDALLAYEQGLDATSSVDEDGTEGDMSIDDPRVEVIRAQIAALDPHSLLETLQKLAVKQRLTPQDRRLFAKIAFEQLELVAEVLEKAREYQEYFEEEIRLLESILRVASIVSKRLLTLRAPTAHAKRGAETRIASRAMKKWLSADA